MAGGEDEEHVQHQLDSVLSDLYDFGDDFEPTKGIVSESEQQSEGDPPDTETSEAAGSGNHQLPDLECPTSKRKKKNPSFFFNAIKDELCSQPKGTDVPSCSVSEPNLEVVTFVSHKKKKKTKSSEVQDINAEINMDLKVEGNNKTFDFEKIRLEVHKFGIRGYKKEKQRKFEQERAIMLGAKPPKREYVNYKAYQESKKEQDQAKKEKSLAENTEEPLRKKPKQQGQKVRRKAKRSSSLVPNGQVGRYRDGALILSSKDIQRIKQSKFSK